MPSFMVDYVLLCLMIVLSLVDSILLGENALQFRDDYGQSLLVMQSAMLSVAITE